MDAPEVLVGLWVGLLWLLRTTCCHPAGMSYGAIIDAGSSGSRVRVYEWPPKTSDDKLPEFREVFNKKLEPGISSYRDDLGGLRSYMGQLVEAARANIPDTQHAVSPIFLMATAGMRLLMEPKANDIMEEIQDLLADPDVSPFRFTEIQARILSGEEEGVFAWIAANYLNNYFMDPDGIESAGILELGGASTQIAFIPGGSILADKFPVRLAGRTYPLYVHSYLYYGQNFAELWVKEYLHRESPQLAEIVNPCMLKGDSGVTSMGGRDVMYRGSGDPATCVTLVHKLVFKVESYQCYPKPCAIGQVYQPTIEEDKLFFALSAFTYPLRTLEVLDEEGVFTPEDATNSAMEYCQKDIQTIINDTGRKRDFLSVECLMGLYIPILFTKAYGFSNNTRQVTAKFDINGAPLEWTLGALIYETERRVESSCPVPRASPIAATATTRHSQFVIITFTIIHLITHTLS